MGLCASRVNDDDAWVFVPVPLHIATKLHKWGLVHCTGKDVLPHDLQNSEARVSPKNYHVTLITGLKVNGDSDVVAQVRACVEMWQSQRSPQNDPVQSSSTRETRTKQHAEIEPKNAPCREVPVATLGVISTWPSALREVVKIDVQCDQLASLHDCLARFVLSDVHVGLDLVPCCDSPCCLVAGG